MKFIRTLAVVVFGLVVMVGCSSTNESHPPTLIGSWLYVNDTFGQGMTFRTDMTYTGVILEEKSSTLFNAYIENGTYTVSKNQLTLTPHQDSCPPPGGISLYTFGFQGNDLALVYSGGSTTVFQPNNEPPASNVMIIDGCFDSKGGFTPHAIGPVGN